MLDKMQEELWHGPIDAREVRGPNRTLQQRGIKPQDVLPETHAHVQIGSRYGCLGFMHQTCCVIPARQAKALLHVLYGTHWAGEISS